MASTEEQPCQRCILLNLKCFSSPFLSESDDGRCKMCHDAGSILSCIPTSELLQDFETGPETLLELGRGEWLFRDPKFKCWRARLDYRSFTQKELDECAVIDYTSILRTVTPNPTDIHPTEHASDENMLKFARTKFLNQFHSAAARLGHRYDSMTYDILDAAATFQEAIDDCSDYGYVDDCTSALFLALRCFSMAQDLGDIDSGFDSASKREREYLPYHHPDLRRPGAHPSWHATIAHFGLAPAIYISRVDAQDMVTERTELNPDSLSHCLRKTLDAIHRLLLRGRPNDWVAVLYALGVLTLVLRSMMDADAAHSFKEMEDALRHALWRLCELFLYCSNGSHPLREEPDLEGFLVIVGSDALSAKYYRELSRLWISQDVLPENIPKPNDHEDFLECLQLFVLGDA